MATHTQLPIYKVAYDLLDVVTDLVKNMQRDFKRSIGDKIATECIEITVLVLLVVPGICGCKRDDIAPAGCLTDGCEPGYLHTHSVTGAWVISTNPEHPGDESLQATIDTCG